MYVTNSNREEAGDVYIRKRQEISVAFQTLADHISEFRFSDDAAKQKRKSIDWYMHVHIRKSRKHSVAERPVNPPQLGLCSSGVNISSPLMAWINAWGGVICATMTSVRIPLSLDTVLTTSTDCNRATCGKRLPISSNHHLSKVGYAFMHR